MNVEVKEILEKLNAHEISVAEAEKRMKEETVDDLGYAIAHQVGNILGTRCSAEKYEAVKIVCPDMEYDEEARIIQYNREAVSMNKGVVVVACAGTSDLPVAKEAAITARFLGNHVEEIFCCRRADG